MIEKRCIIKDEIPLKWPLCFLELSKDGIIKYNYRDILLLLKNIGMVK